MVISMYRRKDLKRGRSMRVAMHDKIIPNVYYADGRRGVVKYFTPDKDGHAQLNAERTDIMRSEIRGKVTWIKL
jgi:hypothetical protein